MHLRQHDHQKKLLSQSVDEPCTLFGIIDCEAIDVTVIRPFPFKVTFTYIWFLSSCNGLILVGLKNRMHYRRFSYLILWNPLTSEYKIFSKINSPGKDYDVSKKVFELYYSSSDDDYRILHVTEDHDVYIYSLKSDSWRKVDSTNTPNRNFYDKWRRGACLNENLYFLIYTYDGERHGSYSVIRFDSKTERFTKIPTPDFQNWCSSLTAERGCIYLCHKANPTVTDPCVTELWKMSGEDGRWVKCLNYHGCMQLLHLLRDGYWLMKSDTGSIGKVDLQNQHEGKHFEYSLHGLHRVQRYIETFVSPNQ